MQYYHSDQHGKLLIESSKGHSSTLTMSLNSASEIQMTLNPACTRGIYKTHTLLLLHP